MNKNIKNYFNFLIAIYDTEINIFYDEIEYIISCIRANKKHLEYPEYDTNTWVKFVNSIKNHFHFDRTCILQIK